MCTRRTANDPLEPTVLIPRGLLDLVIAYPHVNVVELTRLCMGCFLGERERNEMHGTVYVWMKTTVWAMDLGLTGCGKNHSDFWYRFCGRGKMISRVPAELDNQKIARVYKIVYSRESVHFRKAGSD